MRTTPPAPFIRSFLTRVPLRAILIVPFVLQILGAVGLVGYLSFRNGEQAVNEMAGKLRSEMSARVEGELKSYLDSPHGFNRINAATFAEGQLDMVNASNAVQFLRQLQVSDFIYASYCGDEKEQFLLAFRYAEGSQSKIVLGASNATSLYNLDFHRMDDNGNQGGLFKRLGPYDPRERPWYKAAVEAGRPTWGKVYLDFATGLPTITASEPVYGKSNHLLGVCATDVVLLQELRQFLAKLSLGDSGIAFVMDRSGALLSSSTDETLTLGQGEKMTLLQATNSSETLTRETARYLQNRFGSFAAIQQAQQLDFSLANNRQFVQVTVSFEQQGQTRRIQTLGAGNLVGELDFFRNFPHQTSATVDAPSTLYRLSTANFRQMQQEKPDVAAAFQSAVIQILGDRLTQAYKEIADLLRS